MAGKKYGLEDKYKMMYGGMTNPPVRANVGLFIRAGVAGAKKIAGALAKSKDIKVGSTLNKARDVSKYDTSTLTDKGAFMKRSLQLRVGPLKAADVGKKSALPDTTSEFMKRRLQLSVGPLKAADVGKKSVVKEAVKKTLKNPVVKYGSAATAGYEAKEIVDDMKKPEGKRSGGAAMKGKGAVTGGSGLQDEKLKSGKMYKAAKGGMSGKIKKVMSEYKKGELNIGTSKKKVKSRKQAIAIALSSARKKKA